MPTMIILATSDGNIFDDIDRVITHKLLLRLTSRILTGNICDNDYINRTVDIKEILFDK